jgi:hypothetical protein
LIDDSGNVLVNAAVVLHDIVGERRPGVIFSNIGVPHVDHDLLHCRQFPCRNAQRRTAFHPQVASYRAVVDHLIEPLNRLITAPDLLDGGLNFADNTLAASVQRLPISLDVSRRCLPGRASHIVEKAQDTFQKRCRRRGVVWGPGRGRDAGCRHD